MKDKKLWLLIFLTVFWLFFFFKDKNNNPEVSHVRRGSRQRQRDIPEESSPDLEKFRRRTAAVINRDRNIFTPPRPKRVVTEKPVVTEETYIKEELNRVMFLGILSSGNKKKVYIEYQNEILEIYIGDVFNISTRNKTYNVSIGVEGDVISLKEDTHSVKREINI